MIDLPSIADLAADPARVVSLPAEAARVVLGQVAAEVARWQTLAEALRQRVVASTAAPAEDGTVMLGVDDLARLLGRRRSWVEHHVDDLPPRRSLCGQPVWLRSDVERWLKGLPTYGEARCRQRGRP